MLYSISAPRVTIPPFGEATSTLFNELPRCVDGRFRQELLRQHRHPLCGAEARDRLGLHMRFAQLQGQFPSLSTTSAADGAIA